MKEKITMSWLMEETFFHQPIISNIKTYENRKIATGEEYDHTTVYWIILISNKIINCNSLSKQQALDVDRKAKDQANFTGNLGSCRKNKSFSFLEKEKK